MFRNFNMLKIYKVIKMHIFFIHGIIFFLEFLPTGSVSANNNLNEITITGVFIVLFDHKLEHTELSVFSSEKKRRRKKSHF